MKQKQEICYKQNKSRWVIIGKQVTRSNKLYQMGCLCACLKSNGQNYQQPNTLQRGQVADLIGSQENLSRSIQTDNFIDYAFVKLQKHIFTGNNLVFTRHTDQSKENTQIFVVDEDKDYQNYVNILNESLKNNERCVTKILSNLFSRYQGRRPRRLQTQNQLNISQVNLSLKGKTDSTISQSISAGVIKKFLFLYTSDQVYRKLLRTQVRHKKYKEIAQIVAELREHVESHDSKATVKQFFKDGNNMIYQRFPRIIDPKLQQLGRMPKGNSKFIGSFWTAYARQGDAVTTNSWISIRIKPKLEHLFLVVDPSDCKKGQQKLIVFPFLCIMAEDNENNIKGNNRVNLKFRQANPNKKLKSISSMISIS